MAQTHPDIPELNMPKNLDATCTASALKDCTSVFDIDPPEFVLPPELTAAVADLPPHVSALLNSFLVVCGHWRTQTLKVRQLYAELVTLRAERDTLAAQLLGNTMPVKH
jgi:hypothetical protein